MDKSFTKGLAVLEALATSEEPRGVSDLARELAITKSNVHRLLQTLVTTGFVEPASDRGTYRASLKLWRLGSGMIGRLDVRRVAEPRLKALAARSEETANLSILDEHWMVYVDRIESEHYVRTYTRLGRRSPAHCTGTGKALLAHAPESIVAAALADLKRFTPRTITDPEAMRAELAAIRARGWAATRSEWNEGVVSIAAPVRDQGGTVVAALGISGPAERLKPAKVRSLAKDVVEAADAVSRDLGWNGA